MLTSKELSCWTIWTKAIHCYLESVALTFYFPCRFVINFKTGQSVGNDDDIAFHFNPRIGSKVALNSFRNKKWEAEESFSDNPFKKGQAFEMFTVIKSEGYQVCVLYESLHIGKRTLGTCPHMSCVALDHQVYVNGKEQYTFKHRIPLEKVSALNIAGDVAVNLFGFIQVTNIFYRSANIAALMRLCRNPLRITWKVKCFLNTLSLCSLIRTGAHLHFLQKLQQKSSVCTAQVANISPYSQRSCSQSKTL